MCDQTEISYSDGEVVWVKLGNCWWPGEVLAPNKLAPDVLRSFRKPPIAIVKFFQEDAYEFVKNINSIYKYQCSRKHEFINKGLTLYRTRHGQMEKFPEDVIRAETKVGGDIEILTRDEFQETKKESYAGIFGTPVKKTPGSVKKGRGRPATESPKISTPVRRMKEKTDYKVHILVQGSKSTVSESPTASDKVVSPSTSTTEATTLDENSLIKPDSDKSDNIEKLDDTEKSVDLEKPISKITPTTPSLSIQSSGAGIYACHACPFTTTRLNVLILHNKTHSVGFVPYTPSPVKKQTPKPTVKSTPNSSKTPKQRKPRKEKSDKPKIVYKKRVLEEKTVEVQTKKPKTDEEIKSSLLADWDDDADDESNDESATTTARSPEVPLGAESPAVPTPAELPATQVLSPVPVPCIRKSNSSLSTEKPEASSDSNKYEFCEDEDWHVEADAGRKIPRVKNPVRTEESKSLSLDDDDMAREVAELLNRTAVPELPSVPEPLKVEENFPEPSVVKSPDKSLENKTNSAPDDVLAEVPTTKAIFKTKTFFRSRHSRSQDAIGKYVAEQLNNVDKMDIVDSDLNGSDNVSSPEARDSPPIDQVKVARLAPKIQLKRMKAEAQLRGKEKNRFEPSSDPYSLLANIMVSDEKPDSPLVDEVKENIEDSIIHSKCTQNVLYPTQEIKPVSEIETPTKEISPPVEPAIINKTSTENEDNNGLINHHVIEDETEVSKDSSVMDIDNGEDDRKTHSQIAENEIQLSATLYRENSEKSIGVPSIKLPEQLLCETPEPTESITPEPRESITLEPTDSNVEEPKPQPEPYMNESTASAVDALLNVSRDSDRVTRVISDDPPEDLFEDDKEDSVHSNINGDHDVPNEVEQPEQIMEYDEVLCNENKQDLATKEIEIDQAQNSLPINEELKLNENSNDNVPYEQNKVSVPENEENSTIRILNKYPSTEHENGEENVTVNSYSDEIENEKLTDGNEITVTEEINPQIDFAENEALNVQEETVPNEFIQSNLQIPETLNETEHIMIHSGLSENEEEIVTTQETEIVTDDNIYLQNEEEIPAVQDETEISLENNPDEFMSSSEVYQNEEVVTTQGSNENDINIDQSSGNIPSESDLQIAEALINLPATVHSKTPAEHIENHILTSSFENDNTQEQIIQPSDDNNIDETISLPTEPQCTNDVRFETEREKSENLNAAQSLLHMSESIEHTIGMPEAMDTDVTEPAVINLKQNNGIGNLNMSETSQIYKPEIVKKSILSSSSKLLQMLEEPSRPKFSTTKVTPTKHIVMRGKEKILNFDVAKSSFKSKTNSPKQKIIIRRATPTKTILNATNEVSGQDKIILSRTNQAQDGSSVQRFTIQTTDAPSDANTIIIQQKIRKLPKLPAKLQKIKPATSLATVADRNATTESSVTENVLFDINSMPIVLSEDLITAESIEKMPVVMSDANITPAQPSQKHIKPKVAITENEKITVTSMPKKSELKSTMLINSSGEVQNKPVTPNILSKSTKVRGAKPMLVIDKVTGKQKIIMTKAEPALKEIKQLQKTTIVQKAPTLIQKASTLLQKAPTLVQKTLLQKPPTLIQKSQTLIQAPTLLQTTPTLLQTTQTLIQAAPTMLQSAPTLIQTGPQIAKKSQGEKYIILPTQNAHRPGRTQKIVIDPQTGKAHMILTKNNEPQAIAPDNKPVSAKLVPSKSEAAPGNTVMIITNAQGAQSRIVLTPEHEKILFPNKQQQKTSQLKTIAHRITTTNALKTILTPPAPKQIVTSAKTPTKIVPKQKNAIITSKGQLIVGGRVATTAQNIAPMPEQRQPTKRLIQAEPKKIVQIQKTNSEPLIFLHQKSGAVMQLTASQFEQLQRSGQIVQKAPAQPVQERVIIQKSRTIAEAASGQKSRVRRSAAQSPSPAKRSKQLHEVAIAPAPARLSPLLPALTPLAPTVAPPTPTALPAPTICIAPLAPTPISEPTAGASYSDLDNFEEMLPSTAIARQPLADEPAPEPTAPDADAAAAAVADGQLLAVPGEHFGGPPGSFYLCVEEQGTYTPIDNRPLVLENNQLMPMSEVAPPAPSPAAQPERRDILSAALANSEVFHADAADAPDFRDLNANVSVHCRVSETSTTLHQPIMTTQEMPSSAAELGAPPASLEDGLAVIGVTAQSVPTSLELPITVTDPRIAPRPAPTQYPALLPAPGADLCYAEPISMPLLTEEEDGGAGGKSMPILTEEAGERTVSSVESALDSPASLDAAEDAGAWPRRLLTPGSDASDLSAEIPLQPSIMVSVADLADHT